MEDCWQSMLTVLNILGDERENLRLEYNQFSAFCEWYLFSAINLWSHL